MLKGAELMCMKNEECSKHTTLFSHWFPAKKDVGKQLHKMFAYTFLNNNQVVFFCSSGLFDVFVLPVE